MPIYEYECRACGHGFEAIQKMSDTALIDCPACAQPQLRKKLSASAFHLKGSGWYQTDFKGGKKAPASEGESDAAPQVKETQGETKDNGGSKEAPGKDSKPEPTVTPPKTPDSSAA
ncbi:MAG: zinc ribbon domain-containing protein [Gammaproteobacteria bacterium]